MNILKELYKRSEVSSVSVCNFSRLTARMDDKRIFHALSLCPDCSSVLFILFPYYAGNIPGNLSFYARGRDYHDVIYDILTDFIQNINPIFPMNHFVPLVDASPLPEVYGAYISGCGILGRNGLIFDRTYGSYVFIGTIMTDLSIPETSGSETCSNCGACIHACPTGALSGTGICLSHLTQTGGELSVEKQSFLQTSSLIWGCDLCSTVCPMNRNTPISPNGAFTENLICNLKIQDLTGLTRKAFLKKYIGRAFTWKGPAPLLRNLRIQKENEDF